MTDEQPSAAPATTTFGKNLDRKVARLRAAKAKAKENRERRQRKFKARRQRKFDRKIAWSPTRVKRHQAACRRAWQKRKTTEASGELPDTPQPPDTSPVKAGQSLATNPARYQLLPQHVQEEFAAFKAELFSDQGGDTLEMTAMRRRLIERTAQLDMVFNLLILDLQTRGLLTLKGKVRSTLDAIFKTSDRFNKYVVILGMERRTKKVTEKTIDDYLKEEPIEVAVEPMREDE